MNKPNSYQKNTRRSSNKKPGGESGGSKGEKKLTGRALVKQLINEGNSFEINEAAKNFAYQCGNNKGKVTRTQVRKLFGAFRKIELKVKGGARNNVIAEMARLMWLAENAKRKLNSNQGRIFYEVIVQTALQEFKDYQVADSDTEKFKSKFKNLMSLMEAIVAYLPEK